MTSRVRVVYIEAAVESEEIGTGAAQVQYAPHSFARVWAQTLMDCIHRIPVTVGNDALPGGFASEQSSDLSQQAYQVCSHWIFSIAFVHILAGRQFWRSGASPLYRTSRGHACQTRANANYNGG